MSSDQLTLSSSIGLEPSISDDPLGDDSVFAIDDVSFDGGNAPKALQRRSDGPWNHLRTADTHALLSPDPSQSAEFGPLVGRNSSLEWADPYIDLPEGQWTDDVVRQAGKHHGSGTQPSSSLSFRFATRNQTPAVQAPSTDQQWLSTGPGQLSDGACCSGDVVEYAFACNRINPTLPSEPPPSIITTDESYAEESFWDGGRHILGSVYDTATDIDGSSQAASQLHHQSLADVDFRHPGYGSPQNNTWSPLVDRSDDGSRLQEFDSRFLSPCDLGTQPIAVPFRPTYDSYKPGIAASYPPASIDRPRCRKSTAKRAIAPRRRRAVTECPTPQGQTSMAGHSLSIVREDGKGGTSFPPLTPKKGRRIGWYV